MAVVGRMDVDEAMQEHLSRSEKESSRGKDQEYNQARRLQNKKNNVEVTHLQQQEMYKEVFLE